MFVDSCLVGDCDLVDLSLELLDLSLHDVQGDPVLLLEVLDCCDSVLAGVESGGCEFLQGGDLPALVFDVVVGFVEADVVELHLLDHHRAVLHPLRWRRRLRSWSLLADLAE